MHKVMPKEFDKKILNTASIRVVEDAFERMLHVNSSGDPISAEKDIIEFDSRMRVFPMEKFNGPCYIAAVNFYLSPKDFENSRAVGAFIFYIKEDFAEKLLKAFNRSIKDAEHEDALMDVVGEMAKIIAGNLKNEIAGAGYIDLTVSEPLKYKNHVSDGVQFDYSLYTKQEISFTYWGHKCVAVEVCFGSVPQK